MLDDKRLDTLAFAIKYETKPESLRAIAKGLLLQVKLLQQEIKDGKATEASEAGSPG